MNMPSEKYDVSLVIPIHHEGRLAQHTLKSALRSVAYALKKGVRCQVMVVQDRADEKTKEFLKAYSDSGIVFKSVDFGDLGLTRNYGVQKASADYIAFLDADNLFGKRWLFDAFNYCTNHEKPLVLHPEYLVVFEAENHIWRQISSNHPQFRMGNFLESNYWDATCFAKKKILGEFPYHSTMATKGFGYEDWHFNCETFSAGIAHHVVPDTVLFLRKKITGSLLAFTNQTHRMIRPTKLLDPAVFKTMVNG